MKMCEFETSCKVNNVQTFCGTQKKYLLMSASNIALFADSAVYHFINMESIYMIR